MLKQTHLPADNKKTVPETEKKSEKMDIRSTLYWNPTLEIDSQGEGSVEFYASDLPASYHVVIEGVDESGQLYRYSGNLLKNAE